MKRSLLFLFLFLFVFSSASEAQKVQFYANLNLNYSNSYNSYPSFLTKDVKELNKFERDSERLIIALDRNQVSKARKIKRSLEKQMYKEINQTEFLIKRFYSYSDAGLRSKRSSETSYYKRGNSKSKVYRSNRHALKELERRLNKQIQILNRVERLTLYSKYRDSERIFLYEKLLNDFRNTLFDDLKYKKHNHF